MVDSVSTFRAVCRGGLNTGADVLSTGEDSPGSATQLLNYEPNTNTVFKYDSTRNIVTGTWSTKLPENWNVTKDSSKMTMNDLKDFSDYK